jgi:hypothetical protein
VSVLALDGDKGQVQGWNICRDRGLLPTLGDTRSSPHLSVVALGCLNVRDERGQTESLPDCTVDNLESILEGQVLLSEVKEGHDE